MFPRPRQCAPGGPGEQHGPCTPGPDSAPPLIQPGWPRLCLWLRSPRKGLSSPLNFAVGTHKVFGFDAPPSSLTEQQQAAPGPAPWLHSPPAPDTPPALRGLTPAATHAVSPAITARSLHTNRKVSPPLNRPGHLRLS